MTVAHSRRTAGNGARSSRTFRFRLVSLVHEAPGVSRRTFRRNRASVGQTTVTPDTPGTAVTADDLGDGPGA